MSKIIKLKKLSIMFVLLTAQMYFQRNHLTIIAFRSEKKSNPMIIVGNSWQCN